MDREHLCNDDCKCPHCGGALYYDEVSELTPEMYEYIKSRIKVRRKAMEIKISTTQEIQPGVIYFVPNFIKCRHCDHEIPIGAFNKITGMVDCNGGCGKRSAVVDYAKYFGVISSVHY